MLLRVPTQHDSGDLKVINERTSPRYITRVPSVGEVRGRIGGGGRRRWRQGGGAELQEHPG